MKKGKAAGFDGIQMEAWGYGGTAVIEGLVDSLMKVWKEGTIPKDWKTGVMMPVYKKGDPETEENYRGISLLCMAYKIYAEVLKNILEREITRKMLMPESQSGFRKGRGTMDNVFVLNHLVQRAKRGEKKKVYALFVDLKAVFDKDRGKLWKVMEEMKINKDLRERIQGLYEETRSTIRTKDGMTEEFETKKGVRQGCILNPVLFNLYMAGID